MPAASCKGLDQHGPPKGLWRRFETPGPGGHVRTRRWAAPPCQDASADTRWLLVSSGGRWTWNWQSTVEPYCSYAAALGSPFRDCARCENCDVRGQSRRTTAASGAKWQPLTRPEYQSGQSGWAPIGQVKVGWSGLESRCTAVEPMNLPRTAVHDGTSRRAPHAATPSQPFLRRFRRARWYTEWIRPTDCLVRSNGLLRF